MLPGHLQYKKKEQLVITFHKNGELFSLSSSSPMNDAPSAQPPDPRGPQPEGEGAGACPPSRHAPAHGRRGEGAPRLAWTALAAADGPPRCTVRCVAPGTALHLDLVLFVLGLFGVGMGFVGWPPLMTWTGALKLAPPCI